uniref:protein SLC31A2-like isoform X2 n=1 Tax=Myxine glutinosa TaxID=7769 RepID=UPI00358F5E6A
MQMFFHFSCKATLLFKQWHVTSCAEMVVSVAFLFLLAATYEALKVFCQRVQHSWFRTTRYIENDGEVVQREAHSSATASEQSIESEARLLRSNRKIVTVSCNHLLKGLFCSSLHMLQVFTGYVLMLAVMSYNAWVFLGILAGAGLGYFLSYPFLPVMSPSLPSTNPKQMLGDGCDEPSPSSTMHELCGNDDESDS